MKALNLKEPGHFECIELPDLSPDQLGSEEALVRVHHVGVCGTDIHAYLGHQPFFTYPRIPGHELGVEIVALGAGVKGLEPGMRCSVEAYLSEPVDRAFARGKTNCSASTKCLGVHVDGGMREQFILPAKLLHPSNLPTRSLALVETLCIGHHAVERAALLGDEVVAVVGMGPIGLGVVEFASLAGVKVVAMDISKERLEKASSWHPGLTTVQVDPSQGPLEAWTGTGLEFPEVVWDCTGNKHSMEASIGMPANGGRIVMVGIFIGDVVFSDPEFHKRELSIIGTRNATSRNFRSVINLIESGLVDVDAWITHESTPEAFPREIDGWLEKKAGLLKGIIRFGG